MDVQNELGCETQLKQDGIVHAGLYTSNTQGQRKQITSWAYKPVPHVSTTIVSFSADTLLAQVVPYDSLDQKKKKKDQDLFMNGLAKYISASRKTMLGGKLQMGKILDTTLGHLLCVEREMDWGKNIHRLKGTASYHCFLGKGLEARGQGTLEKQPVYRPMEARTKYEDFLSCVSSN